MHASSARAAAALAVALGCAGVLPLVGERIALAAPLPETTASAAAMPPQLPLRRDAAIADEAVVWKPGLALLVLCAAAAGVWAWRRAPEYRWHQRTRGGASVLRLSSQALTQHASVHAVQWQGEEFLLGCTPQQVTLLSRKRIPAVPGEGHER